MTSKWALVKLDDTTSQTHAIEPTQTNRIPQPTPKNDTTADIAKISTQTKEPRNRSKIKNSQYPYVLGNAESIIYFQSSNQKEYHWHFLGRTWTCVYSTSVKVRHGGRHLLGWQNDLAHDRHAHQWCRGDNGHDTLLFRMDVDWATATVYSIAEVARRARDMYNEE
jgi:hypothetical protein